MIFTLGSGHRVDDGLDALESALVHLRILGEISERPEFREHADDLLERAHLAQLAQLIAKVFERELVPSQLALELCGFLGIDRSEERRVGKGCRSWWSAWHGRKMIWVRRASRQ